MDRGTYSAASAGFMQLRKLDVINNNLANVNTAGFKRQRLVGRVQSFDDTLARLVEAQDPYARGDHERTPGVVHVKAVTDFSQGSIKPTGNNLDVALKSENDFFVIGLEGGQKAYTRAGNFSLNEEGQIVTLDGFPVQGDGGVITANAPNIQISGGGSVKANDEEVGRLQVVHFDDPSALQRLGGCRFQLPAGFPPPTVVENPQMETRALEMANVSVITSVIDLIGTTRGFEMYSKSAKSIDEMNQAAISRVGKGR
ncbi:flagellar hook-basal body protein [Oligoflexia bacterium]|nr:flagellar hook-basal body protein [Oligoflexia bacterium]